MTPKTDTDTRYAARSGAGVPPAHAPDVLAPTGRDHRRAIVSWWHVLPLGVALAFANEFWIIVLRGAVGAIERTSAPFSTWLHETVLLVPVYVVAVLAAFRLAQRWFGPRPRGFKAAAGSIGTIAAAATAAGILLLAVSSWFDYRLQATDLRHMSAAHPGCPSSCLNERIHATVNLEFKAIWIGLLLMLVTDLALIALMVAFRGGVLVLARRPSATSGSRVDDTRLVLVAGLVGAAAVNAAVVHEHLDTSGMLAALLAVLAGAQVTAAAAVVLVPARARAAALLAAAVVSAVPLLVWLVARTTGLPFVDEVRGVHSIAVSGVMSALLEVACLAIAVALLRGRRSARPWDRHLLAIATTALLAGALVGVGGAELPAGMGAFSTLDNPLPHHVIVPVQG